MTAAGLAFDAVLASALVAVAWRTLGSSRVREGVVLFIAFGLLSALAWSRLGAPDIALVEAAVGTGLTGALLMSALAWADAAPRARGARRASVLLPVALAVALLLALRAIAEPRAGLASLVRARLRESGIDYPVTAVLLDFRGYDTLLEIMVLLCVATAIRELRPVTRPAPGASPGPLLDPLLGWLLSLFVMVAGYLVWRGAYAPGGAFQAGAILAGGAVLFLLAREGVAAPWSSRAAAALLIAGPVAFLALAALPLAAGDALLEYPRRAKSALIFALESLLALSIALALAMFMPRKTAPDSRRAAQPREPPS